MSMIEKEDLMVQPENVEQEEEITNNQYSEEKEQTQDPLSEEKSTETAEETVECEESAPVDNLTKVENELKALNDKHLRLIAEYDNYRKRTLKEKLDMSKTAGEKIFTDILPLIDDFERALQHIEKSIDLKAVKDGIELIYNKFINFLLQHGVKEVETTTKEFDAEIYEAVAKVPAPSAEMKNKIMDCVEKGYMLDDKVIRYPKVVVGE